MDVLQLDISGRPQAWISPREAAILYASDAVAWTLGDTFQVLRGGWQRATGRQSRIEVHPIVAVRGAVPSRAWRQTPGADQPQALARDRQVCAYCGGHFPLDELTREHIVPVSRGGLDSWMNCITACRACNGHKAIACPKRRACPCSTCPTCPACTKT
jgi:5-methylcytosine-specific restriction endonuclease McrA